MAHSSTTQKYWSYSSQYEIHDVLSSKQATFYRSSINAIELYVEVQQLRIMKETGGRGCKKIMKTS